MKKTRARKLLGVFVLIVILAGILVNSFVLPSFLRKTIGNIDTGDFQLEVGSIRTGFLNQSITLSAVHLSDSLGFAQVEIDKIRLGGIGVVKLLTNRELKARSLQVKHPSVQLSKEFKFPARENKSVADSTKQKILVKNLTIEEASFLLFDQLNSSDSIFSIDLDLALKNFEVNRNEADFSYKSLGADKVKFNLSNIVYLTKNRDYRISGASMAYSSVESDLVLNDLLVHPLRSPYEVGNRNGFQSDWFDADFEQISFENINLEKLLKEKQLWVDKTKIDKARARTFRDLRLPVPHKPDTKLPDHLIAGIPLPINCDSLLINGAAIQYTDRAPGSTKEGKVEFTNLNLRFPNFTNIDSLIKEPLKMKVSAQIMKSAILDAEMMFSSVKFPNTNRMKGKVSPMSFSAFNSMTEPGMHARIDGGTIRRLDFDFSYNEDVSSGTMTMDYEGLEIHIFNDEKDKKLESFLLNKVMIKKQNLPEDRHYKKGEISFERDKKKSVFNYWWKSILSGMKSIMI